MRVSVVVNTYQRAAALADTLDGLQRLDGPEIEVVVVNGPSTDGTEELLSRWAGRIKVGACAERNLSMSRNIGIALAAGEVVAFIDDDAVPEPDWVLGLVAGYDDDEVAAVGGPVLDHTGVAWQVQRLRSNRYGDTVVDRPGHLDAGRALSVPGAAWFPSVLGASSSFRRPRLVEIGGFDEQYDYFLDETDVCVRLVDAGWVVRQVATGVVHHRYLPSSIRTADHVVRNRYPVFKNAAYFAVRHGLATQSFAEVAAGFTAFVERHRRWLQDSVEAGAARPQDIATFEEEVRSGSAQGFDDAMAGPARTRPAAFFAAPPPFLPLSFLRPPGPRLHVAFVTREHPPGPLNGIGRLYHAQARALADRGHVVRVITASPDHERVDFEDGVWVHRALPDAADPPPEGVPAPLWAWSATARDRLLAAQGRRPLDAVEVPSWDAEGIAILGALDCVTALGVYTPLTTLRRLDHRVEALPRAEIDALVALERRCVLAAPLLVASGPWTIEEVEAGHGLRIDRAKVRFAAHGLADKNVSVVPEQWGDGPGLLFVGRLEPRKGIDVLLAILSGLLAAVPGLTVTVAGDDPDGYGARWAASAPPECVPRVRFLGRVDDERLLKLYAGATVFVAPSRYESFGLVLLEAMMFGVAVVASAIGGMGQIVQDGTSGLLVPPGDAPALRAALEQALADEPLRRRLGAAGRARYLASFTPEAMAEQLEAAFAAAQSARR